LGSAKGSASRARSAPPVTCNPGMREVVNKFLQAFAQWIEKNIAK
jgi:hypothetical protein